MGPPTMATLQIKAPSDPFVNGRLSLFARRSALAWCHDCRCYVLPPPFPGFIPCAPPHCSTHLGHPADQGPIRPLSQWNACTQGLHCQTFCEHHCPGHVASASTPHPPPPLLSLTLCSPPAGPAIPACISPIHAVVQRAGMLHATASGPSPPPTS